MTLFLVLQFVFFLICAIIMFIKLYIQFTKRICRCSSNIDGKVVLITGGNTGIGFETAKRLAKHGARVVIASRNLRKSDAAAESIRDITGNSEVRAEALDLSSLPDIKRFTEDFSRSYERLDILINNAGMGQIEHTFTEDGIDKVMQINHFGPSYLTHLLLDKLISSKPSRIIFVSSDLNFLQKYDPSDLIGRKPTEWWVRYGTSKYCNIMSARALSLLLPKGVTANALHPGTTDSEIWEHIPWKIPRHIMYRFVKFVCRTVEECAQTSIHASLAPSLKTVTGQYLDECDVAKATVLPSTAETNRIALEMWENTIKIAEDIIIKRSLK